MNKWHYFVLVTFLLLLNHCSAHKNDKIDSNESIATFAKLYGYVKYFHPSDEAQEIDWDMFAIHGAKQVRQANNNDELITILKELFLPIAPGISILKEDDINKNQLSSYLKSKSSDSSKLVSWRHLGNGFNTKQGIYSSSRTNRFVMPSLSSEYSNNFLHLGDSLIYSDSVKIAFKLSSALDGWDSYVDAFFVYRDSNDELFYEDLGKFKSSDWQVISKSVDTKRTLKKYFLMVNLNNTGKIIVDDINFYSFNNKDVNKYYSQNFEDTAGSKISYKEFVNEKYEEQIVANHGFNNSVGLQISHKLDLTEPDKNDTNFYQEPLSLSLGNGLAVILPLTLISSEQKTIPAVNKEKLRRLQSLLKQYQIGAFEENIDLRLGNLVNCWNAVRHFYPYQESMDEEWDRILLNLIQEATEIKSTKLILKKMISKLNDGHGIVWDSTINHQYYAPLIFELIGGKPIVGESLIDSLSYMKGFELSSINNQTFENFFQENRELVSGASDIQRRGKLVNSILSGLKTDTVSVTLRNFEGVEMPYIIKHSLSATQYINASKAKNLPKKIQLIDSSLYYIDISRVDKNSFNESFQDLQKAQTLILDGRKKPDNTFRQVIKYFIQEDDTANWMFIPEIVLPDYAGSPTYSSYGWKFKSAQNNFKGKVIYLLGSKTFSYGESVAAYFESRPNTLMIGQTSAGTNGNVNSFNLPGGFTIRYTGMKVLKHDGSQLHGVGIIPDVYVERTPKGIAEGRDEVLEKAIELGLLQNVRAKKDFS